MKSIIAAIVLTLSTSAFAGYQLEYAAGATDDLTNFRITGDVIQTASQLNVTSLKVSYNSSVRGSVSDIVLVGNFSYVGVADQICQEMGARSYKDVSLAEFASDKFEMVTEVNTSGKLEFNFVQPFKAYSVLTQVICTR